METLKKFSQFIQKRADEKAANEKAEMIKKLGEEAYLKLQEAEIKSDDQFKEYAFTVLKKAFGDKFDQAEAQKVVDGLLSKKEGDDYGALVGRLTSSLGEAINDPNNPNPEGYPAPGGESDDVPSPAEEEEDEEIAAIEIQGESTVNEEDETEEEDEEDEDVDDEDEKEKEDHYKDAEEDDEEQIDKLEKDKEYDEEEAEEDSEEDSEADTEDDDDSDDSDDEDEDEEDEDEVEEAARFLESLDINEANEKDRIEDAIDGLKQKILKLDDADDKLDQAAQDAAEEYRDQKGEIYSEIEMVRDDLANADDDDEKEMYRDRLAELKADKEDAQANYEKKMEAIKAKKERVKKLVQQVQDRINALEDKKSKVRESMMNEDESAEIEDKIVAMGEPKDVEGEGEKLVTDEQPIDKDVKGAASKSGEGGDPEIKTGGDGPETAAGIAGDIMDMGKPKSVEGDGEKLVTDEQPIDKDVKAEAPKAGEGGEAEMKPISGDDAKEIEKEIVDMGEPESIEDEAGKLVGERFIMSFDRFVAESRKNS